MTALEGNFPLDNHHLGTGARLLGSVFKTMNPDSFEGSNCVSAGEGSRTHSLFKRSWSGSTGHQVRSSVVETTGVHL